MVAGPASKQFRAALEDALQSLGVVAEYWRFVVLVGGCPWLSLNERGINANANANANAAFRNISVDRGTA